MNDRQVANPSVLVLCFDAIQTNPILQIVRITKIRRQIKVTFPRCTGFLDMPTDFLFDSNQRQEFREECTVNILLAHCNTIAYELRDSPSGNIVYGKEIQEIACAPAR
jgi:hypothetical protein